MAGPGRPKKHLEDQHHFQTSESEADEAVVENPTMGYVESLVPETVIAPVIENSGQELVSVVKNVEYSDAIEDDKGWSPIDTCVHRGLPVLVSELPAGDGVLAHWKRTRAFNGKKWEDTGCWKDHQSGLDLSFPVKYWRERFSV